MSSSASKTTAPQQPAHETFVRGQAHSDHRSASATAAQLQTAINNSPRLTAQRDLQAAIANSPKQAIAPALPRPNRTGLPDQLKQGAEALSGHSLDDVQVHYNSAKPAQMNALAYAQGTDIHVAPGQEEHLPHEAWHVVQQKQGRVQPTTQLKGVLVNDSTQLEHEATLMGGRAAAGVQGNQPNSMHLQDVNTRAEVNSKTYQFALPEAKWEYLPTAATNKTGVNSHFDGKRPSFAKGYKFKLLEYWNELNSFPSTVSRSGNKEYVRTTSGNDVFNDWVPIDAFQIDHAYSWDSISNDLFQIAAKYTKEMTALPVSKKLPLDEQKEEQESEYRAILDQRFKGDSFTEDAYIYDEDNHSFVPSKYAARMYYHDFTNLQPMKGSDNARKADTDSAINKAASEEQLKVESSLTSTYMSMMDSLQNVFSQVDQEDGDTMDVVNGVWDIKNGEAMAPLAIALQESKSINLQDEIKDLDLTPQKKPTIKPKKLNKKKKQAD